MKILILGPVLNNSLSGGVGTFSENLVLGMRELGHDANILSLAKSSSLDNFVIKAKKYSDLSIILKLRKIAKFIKTIQPDLVISSLQYNLGIRLYKKTCPKAKYIAVLHGMSCPINGRLKSFAVNWVARYSVKYFDKTVTVSYLSQAINKKTFGIKCDAVVPNGIDCSQQKSQILETDFQNRKYSFLYLGRLYKDKNVDLLADAFIEAHKRNPNITLAIVGGGPMAPLFEKNGKYDVPGIVYLGKVSHDKVFGIYSQAKCFISLNELEPLATTFMEAAICGCNLIAPYTSGQNQLFFKDPILHCVDITNSASLSNGLLQSLLASKNVSKEALAQYVDKFSCKKMASLYIDLFNDM